MTVAEAIREGEQALAAAAVPNARLDAEVLLAFVLGTRRDLLPARFRDPVDAASAGRFRELVDRRGADRVPLQYLTGVQEFYSLEFQVGPGALIPRPETELLVAELIAFAAERGAGSGGRGLDAADVGTGSGCIAVASAVHVPGLRMLAFDVSPEAIRIAADNARRHGVLDDAPGRGSVRVAIGDLLGAVRPGTLDAVVSNPPYVATRELEGLQAEVRAHEPPVALVSGGTGLEIYERLIPQAAAALRPGGLFALELAAGRHDPVRGMLERGPWAGFAFRDDFQGFPRALVARRT